LTKKGAEWRLEIGDWRVAAQGRFYSSAPNL
jgi:hypothetical protein